MITIRNDSKEKKQFQIMLEILQFGNLESGRILFKNAFWRIID
jgi:hypothetical protein